MGTKSQAEETRQIIAEEAAKAVAAALGRRAEVCSASAESLKPIETEKSTSFFLELDELAGTINALEAELKMLHEALEPVLKQENANALGVLCKKSSEKDSVVVQILNDQSNRIRYIASNFAGIRSRIQLK